MSVSLVYIASGGTHPLLAPPSVNAMASSILRLYEPNAPVWQNATALLSELEWADVTAQTMAEYLDMHGVDRRFSRELVEAATRVNYGQVVFPCRSSELSG